MKMKKIISMMICFSLFLFAVKLDINAEEKVSVTVGNTDVLSTTVEGIKYENGKLEIPVNTLWKLADSYNTSVDYLIGRTDNPNRI